MAYVTDAATDKDAFYDVARRYGLVLAQVIAS